MSDGKRFGRQLRLVTVDQAISSASNVLFLVLAAHVLSLASFGAFNIVFGVYVLLQSVGRGLVSDPLLIHPDEAVRRPGTVLAASAFAGLVIGSLLAVVGLVLALIGAAVGAPLMVLGLTLALLLVQDLGRYIGFASERPGFAVLVDTVWLVAALGTSLFLYVAEIHSLVLFAVAWAGSGGLAGLLVFRRIRSSWAPSAVWIRENWSYSSQYVLGYVAVQGSGLLVTVLVGAILGNGGVGALLAALLLCRPFGTFQIAASSSLIVQISRNRSDGAMVHRSLRRTLIIVLGMAGLMSALLLVLPDGAGRVLIGGAWPAAKPLLPVVCVWMGFTALMTPGRAGLIGLAEVALATRIDVLGAVLGIGLAATGAIFGGVSGALWGSVTVAALSSLLCGIAVSEKMRKRYRPPGAHIAGLPV